MRAACEEKCAVIKLDWPSRQNDGISDFDMLNYFIIFPRVKVFSMLFIHGYLYKENGIISQEKFTPHPH